MGQLLSICTDPSGETAKPNAFQDAANQGDLTTPPIVDVPSPGDKPDATQQQLQQQLQRSQDQRELELREEQARLERIVQVAGREMVAVRSNRGGPYYNDQGFAAALAQHLEQTLSDVVPTSKLPAAPSDSSSVYAILSRPVTETRMDPRADAFLEESISTKEHLFAGCEPMVENLL
uniref:Uncharacterized protein n=1 Tax=Grammatophora oceanica TaxID=210454 RepID=A0A7S1UNZ4_9STRA|mmetsp:Transcript_14378/g.21080  ORF Transcript_14378/g.21080 Transcript_14378/m.21080 type:complete len:177 (+) Transcript_14378:75-605(+)